MFRLPCPSGSGIYTIKANRCKRLKLIINITFTYEVVSVSVVNEKQKKKTSIQCANNCNNNDNERQQMPLTRKEYATCIYLRVAAVRGTSGDH